MGLCTASAKIRNERKTEKGMSFEIRLKLSKAKKLKDNLEVFKRKS